MKQHQMVLKETFPDGSQEWECPICGRHFIMHWPPHYKRVVLEEGDQQVMHSGGTGGVVMGPADIQQGEQEPSDLLDMVNQEATGEDCGEPVDINDPYLAPFVRWLETHNIDQ